MLYEMLAGVRPFTGTKTKILYDHAHTPPPPFAELAPSVDVPPAAEAVVRRCLEKDPANRPQSVRELFESFSKAVGVEPSLETIPPPVFKPPTEDELPPPIPTPSFLARLEALLTSHKQAIVGGLTTAAVFVGVLAAVVLYRRWSRTEANVPQPIKEWLQTKGFEPTPKDQLGDGGWPLEIRQLRGEPPRRMVLNGNYYLPADWEADSPSGTDERGLPKVLKSTKTGSRFVLLEGGKFLMGNFNQLRSKDQELPFERDEEPGHWVTLSRFYMQATEVSIDEFERFCTARSLQRTDPAVEKFFKAWQGIASRKRENAAKLRDHPATGVSRRMALEFARWIGGDLPTEAQWEFAARSGGKPWRFVWGNDDQRLKAVARMANVANPGGPTQVDLEENPDRTEQGIDHMAGNVREWTRDAWGIYLSQDQADPLRTPDEGEKDPYYAIRGGSYETETETARTTWRSGDGSPGYEYKLKGDLEAEDLGFRVVLEILQCPKDPGVRPQTTASRETRP
jgi:serine/threonine-protein kinase